MVVVGLSSLWYSKTSTTFKNHVASYRTVGSVYDKATITNATISLLPVGDPNAKTLALLYPTGLVGGYRNQAMRFVAFVHYAVSNDFRQILLPSLQWSTRYNGDSVFWPIAFSELFDVEHWNGFHETRRLHDNASTISLPLLVDSLNHSDCWQFDDFTEAEIENMRQLMLGTADHTTATSSMIPVRNDSWFVPKLTAHSLLTPSSPSRSMLGSTPTRNVTLQFLSGHFGTNFRRLNFQDNVQHCQHPAFHGGGTRAGVLWNEFVNKIAGNSIPLIATLQQALIPAPQWRQLAHQCLGHYLGHGQQQQQQQRKDPQPYMVLHARIEHDMMVHRCGREMEMNLTNIFDMVDRFIDEHNKKADTWRRNNRNYTYTTNPRAHQHRRLQGTMLAVGRQGMQDQDGNPEIQDMILRNWKVLNQRSISYHNATNGKRKISSTKQQQQQQLPVFECGDGWIQEAFYKARPDVVDNYYGDILPSILNFWLAVQADVFVGVMKSSWSNDVWRTRFYLGKGDKNYQYVSYDGGMIIPVENSGLPPKHEC
jgi:hypothetical protein